MRRSVCSLALIALFAAGSSAHADTVRLTSFTFGNASPLNINGSLGSVDGGQMKGTWNGASFSTYCVDIYQSVNFNTSYTDYSLTSGTTAWGSAKSTQMDRLMSYFAANEPANADQSAVAQAAIWEVLYETGGSYSFRNGSFTNVSYLDSGVNNGLNAFDWNKVASTAITVHADVLASATHQDLMVLTPVPEPSTWALMFGGLLAIGFTARRRMS